MTSEEEVDAMAAALAARLDRLWEAKIKDAPQPLPEVSRGRVVRPRGEAKPQPVPSEIIQVIGLLKRVVVLLEEMGK